MELKDLGGHSEQDKVQLFSWAFHKHRLRCVQPYQLPVLLPTIRCAEVPKAQDNVLRVRHVFACVPSQHMVVGQHKVSTNTYAAASPVAARDVNAADACRALNRALEKPHV